MKDFKTSEGLNKVIKKLTKVAQIDLKTQHQKQAHDLVYRNYF